MRVRSFLSFAILAAGMAGCSAAPVASGEREASRLLPSTGEPLLDSALRAPSIPDTGSGFSTAENDPAKAVPLLFVSDVGARAVDIFDLNGVETGRITGFALPGAMAVDSARNLYVIDRAKKEVLIFKAGYNGAPTVLTDPDGDPLDVAVSLTGVVAVTNPAVGPSNIDMYAKGSAVPCKTLHSSPRFAPEYVAFDRAGVLFFSAGGNPTGAIGEAVGGCDAKSLTIDRVGSNFSYDRGLVVDDKGFISTIDGLYPAIDTYGPLVDGKLPFVRRIPLFAPGGDEARLFDLALTPSDSDLWTLTPYNAGSPISAAALEFRYPRGGAVVTGIYNVFQSPAAIATTP
ncbi:MAG: hypothetical protein IAI50_08795 [Candidatus Eremiobacteraeota bacterium]|nr:hypothetical protein [Candidatus Eremiobacteraeota bacterium]